jgi:hypothetical protein
MPAVKTNSFFEYARKQVRTRTLMLWSLPTMPAMPICVSSAEECHAAIGVRIVKATRGKSGYGPLNRSIILPEFVFVGRILLHGEVRDDEVARHVLRSANKRCRIERLRRPGIAPSPSRMHPERLTDHPPARVVRLKHS